MANVIFIKPDGTAQPVAGNPGESLIQAARSAGITEILAEYGGNCLWATCHVFASEASLAALPPMTDDEDALMDGSAAPAEFPPELTGLADQREGGLCFSSAGSAGLKDHATPRMDAAIGSNVTRPAGTSAERQKG